VSIAIKNNINFVQNMANQYYDGAGRGGGSDNDAG